MKIKKFKFKEDIKPTPYKFNNIGDKIRGEFQVLGDNKRFNGVKYIIMTCKGTDYIISCPRDLKYKMETLVNNNKISKGSEIIIEYAEDQVINKYKNPKKIFDIFKVEE